MIQYRARRRFGLAALGVAALLVVAGCGDDDAFSDGEDDADTDGEAAGQLVVSGQSFAESEILQNLYLGVLEEAGYEVELRPVGERAVYMQSLRDGQVHIVPDYAASAAEQLNREANGDDADPVASSDLDGTMTALTDLAADAALAPLEPSAAANQNAMVVTQDFAADNDVATISDLAALDMTISFATAPDCEGNAFCEQGLADTYGLEFEKPLLETGFGSADTKLAVQDGDAIAGWTGTTDGTLDTFGLVVLEDDQGLQSAENIVPLVHDESVDEGARTALNELSALLTTEDLVELNGRVDQDRERPEDVAREWLEDHDLVS